MLSQVLKALALATIGLSVALPLSFGTGTNVKALVVQLLHRSLTLKHRLTADKHGRHTISPQFRAFEDLLQSGDSPFVGLNTTAPVIDVASGIQGGKSMATLQPPSSGCTYTEQKFDFGSQSPISVYTVKYNNSIVDVEQSTDSQAIIWLHGGAYVLGAFEGYHGYECYLSQTLGMSVIHIEYSKAPQFPLQTQTQVKQVLTVWKQMVAKDSTLPNRVFIGGDSAGGGLTLLSLQTMVADNVPTPRGAVLLSPWVDLSYSGASWKDNRRKDVMLSSNAVVDAEEANDVAALAKFQADDRWWQEVVFGGKAEMAKIPDFNRADPRWSPLFGSHESLPPLLILASDAELLQSDCEGTHEKALAAGVDSELIMEPHMVHTWPVFTSFYPEGGKSLIQIAEWLKRH